MNIFVYANCQGRAVAKFLPLFLTERKKYKIVHIENYKVIGKIAAIDNLSKLSNWADVFIFQPIDSGQGFFSTTLDADNVRTRTRPTCRHISIPYIYNNGFWPFFIDHDGTHNGQILDAMLDDGADLQDLLQAYELGRLECRFKERIAASLEMFLHRETAFGIDVRLHSFMNDHILSNPLMLIQSHPSTASFFEAMALTYEVLIENKVVRDYRLLERLGENYLNLPGRFPIDHYCAECLPSVYKFGKEEGSENFYRSVIHTHYARWREEKRRIDQVADLLPA